MYKKTINIFIIFLMSLFLASCDSMVSDSIEESKVKVNESLSALTIDKDYVSLNSNATAVITASAKDDEGLDDTITAVSDNTAVATVSLSENIITVNGVKNGSANITITSASGRSVVCPVYVVTVYAAGSNTGSGYWKNGEWVSLSTTAGTIYSLVVSGGDVYAAGSLSRNYGGYYDGGYWKNSDWVKLSSSEKVNSLAVNGSDVYALGDKGYWKNGVRTDLAGSAYNIFAKSLVVSGGDVYAGGYATGTTYGGSSYSVPCYWKNGEQIFISDGTGDDTDGADYGWSYAFTIAGSDIYAAGYKYGGGPGYWKNNQWIACSAYRTDNYSTVNSLLLSGSDIYAGGYNNKYVGDKTVAYAGYWKNEKWNEFTPADPYKASQVYSLVVSGRDVYAGGYRQNSNSVQLAGYWKNGEWNGLSTVYSEIRSVVVVTE